MNDADWLRKHLRGKVQRARAKLPQVAGPQGSPEATGKRLRDRLHRTLERLGRRAPEAPKDPRSG